MTKAILTPHQGSTNGTNLGRQQATEADLIDERWKTSNGGLGKIPVIATDQSPFSPRRGTPKSLDRTNRRPYVSSPNTPIQPINQQITTNPNEKDLSLTKRQSATQQRTPLVATPLDNQNMNHIVTNNNNNNANNNSKESWKNVLSSTQTSNDLVQRGVRRTPATSSKSNGAEPMTTNSRLVSGKSMGKEDSPASVSYSDSGRPKTGTALSTLNRSHQLKSSERLTEQISTQMGSSTVPNIEEPTSPSNNQPSTIMYTSTGGGGGGASASATEHGKPPKTPRSSRTANSRSDGLGSNRMNTTRNGDSEAVSIPAATYAMKLGPQTVMSQWMVSLDDNLDDEEGSDNQHSAKWEDAQERLQRSVETMDSIESLVFKFNSFRDIQIHVTSVYLRI